MNQAIFESINNKTNFQCMVLFLMAIVPVVHLAFGGWTDLIFNLLAILSIIGIMFDKNVNKFYWFGNRLFLMLFFIYPLIIFLSQLFRWQWRIHDYLDQGRFLLAIPVFIYLSKIQINYGKILGFFLPFSMIISYFTTKYIFTDIQYGERFSNNFSDVVAYGQICISMSMLILTILIFTKKQNVLSIIFKLVGISFGIFISIKTQSRTGWIGIPFSAIVIIMAQEWGYNKRHIVGLAFIIAIVVGSFFLESPVVHQRVFDAYYEIMNYPWSGGVAQDGSVSLRITFFRIGWFYFIHSPWYGWGDKGFEILLGSPELRNFASTYAIDYCYVRLFHNELVTQMVRYGAFGILGYVLVFIFPVIKLAFLIKNNPKNESAKLNAALAIVFLITQIFAGISDQVINLKHMVMYFSLLMAGFLSSVASATEADNPSSTVGPIKPSVFTTPS